MIPELKNTMICIEEDYGCLKNSYQVFSVVVFFKLKISSSSFAV